MTYLYHRGFYPLTDSQVSDCYNAGRSPNSGRRLPCRTGSPLQRSAQQTNWDTKIIKGAMANLRHVLVGLNINHDIAKELRTQLIEIEESFLVYNKDKHARLRQKLKPEQPTPEPMP